MRIGIVTFTYGDNYGQRLQNYAMQELLKEYADEVYTLRQIEPKSRFKTRIKRYLKNIKEGTLRESIKRIYKFKVFDLEHIQYYSDAIGDQRNFDAVDRFDYFVAGSDQIWSPFSPDVNSSMFLEFAPNSKRVSFSPSISTYMIPKDKEEYYKKCWNSFKGLSVREYKGAELIKQITGKNAEVTLDPTLMFDETFWAKRVTPPQKKLPNKYFLCYYLGTDQKADQIELICKQQGLEEINILDNKNFMDTDPFEFLYLIQHADIVLTDSFHGTIFSILFKKPFVVFNREGSEINMNSRFDTLDTMFDIKDRYISNLKYDNLMTIQWETIMYNVKIQREKSRKYLSRNLK